MLIKKGQLDASYSLELRHSSYSQKSIKSEADLTNHHSKDLDKLKKFVDECFKKMHGKVNGVKNKPSPLKKNLS